MLFNRDISDCRCRKQEKTKVQRGGTLWLWCTHLSALLVFSFLQSGITHAKYGGGNGSSSAPYLIFTSEHLSQLGHNPHDWDSRFRLMSDIDMSDYNGLGEQESCEPIGYLRWEPFESMPFTGTFDGNGKRITNLRIVSDGWDCTGLFGYVRGSNSSINNLTIVKPKIDGRAGVCTGVIVGKLCSGAVIGCKVETGSVLGSNCTGGLVGYNMSGTIKNCNIRAEIRGNTDVGGVTGYHCGGIISDCSFTGNVTGQSDIGGLAGESEGLIVNCFADGSVWANANKAAGLVGTLRGQVKASFARCTVNGDDQVGGLVGRNTGHVTDSYAQGVVAGGFYIGGLAGLLYGTGTVSYCYVDCISGPDGGAMPIVGWSQYQAVTASFWPVTSFTREQMKLQETYIDAGWDFVDETENGFENLWTICDQSGFPRLWWERFSFGDWDCPEGVDINDLQTLLSLWLVKVASADLAVEEHQGIVNFEDFVVFGLSWRKQPGMPGWNAQCDISPDNGDGIVDVRDLAAFAANWLKDENNHTQGDGIVNFFDWAVFSNAWRSNQQSVNWNARCDLEPPGGDGVVDIKDAATFCERWLESGAGFGDIAPRGKGDEIVNLLDFALAAEKWLRI